MPVLVTNCIPVNKAHAIDFEDRFVHRINHVDQAHGFLRNEVLRPSLTTFDHATGRWRDAEQEDPAAVYRIATLWETMDDFVAWTQSPSFALAHAQKTPQDMFTHAPALDIHEVYLTTEDQATEGVGPPKQGVLVTNCIPVDKAHVADFEDRFAHRIHLVDEAPGFIRNEVLRPVRS
jgi:heme-degrading monooxygenase HmoA